MSRPIKYRNADDLIENCTIKEGCIIWPETDSKAAPVISPASPLAQTMRTNSVARMLFILCRHLPASTRLVKRCNTESCVNPWHYTEANAIVRKRAVLSNNGLDPTSLLPKQESVRHLAFPTDAEIEMLKPKKPEILGALMMSASVAGFDAKGLPYGKKHKFDGPMATPDKPVLVIRKREEAKPEVKKDEPEESIDDFFDMLERGFAARKNPQNGGMSA